MFHNIVGFPHVTLGIHKPALLTFQKSILTCIINAIKYMKTDTR